MKRAECWRAPLEKRARLRAAAAREVAAHGLSRFNLRRLADEAGVNFDIARHHYRTNAALLGDVVRHHHAAVGERMADQVLYARRLPGPARVGALTTALLESLAAEREGHRATLAVVAALPDVARQARHGEEWLVGEFAQALKAACVRDAGTRAVLARSMVWLLGAWAVRLDGALPAERVLCAEMLAWMVMH